MLYGVIGVPEEGIFVPFIDDMKTHLGLHGRLGAALRFEAESRTHDNLLLDEDEPASPMSG
jgi:hypothetical protein